MEDSQSILTSDGGILTCNLVSGHSPSHSLGRDFMKWSHTIPPHVMKIYQTDGRADTTTKGYLFGPIFQLVLLGFFRTRITMRNNN